MPIQSICFFDSILTFAFHICTTISQNKLLFFPNLHNFPFQSQNKLSQRIPLQGDLKKYIANFRLEIVIIFSTTLYLYNVFETRKKKYIFYTTYQIFFLILLYGGEKRTRFVWALTENSTINKKNLHLPLESHQCTRNHAIPHTRVKHITPALHSM